MKTAPQAPRRCLVCGRELTWPALYFDRAACSEAWVRRHREEEPVAGPDPGKRAREDAR